MAQKQTTGEKMVIGILAHVDAGKTTLAECILHKTGTIRELGRVDHGNTFLDTYDMERARGITIFSKQALFSLGEKEITLLDTPGHVDFSAEMERTLQVLDYAILVISGADGVQSHVETLWRLLNRYQVPVFLFVNKMDQPGTDKAALMEELKRKLHDNCVDFSGEQSGEEFWENAAVCSETLMEQYLENGELQAKELALAVKNRELYPCFFGSALKDQKVDAFLEGFEKYTITGKGREQFGARVFKISRDPQGSRLTHIKITGGSLKVKSLIEGDKVDQIRLYSGAGYTLCEEAVQGMVCALTGLEKTYSGQGLGFEKAGEMPLLEPVLTYRVELPEGSDVHKILRQLRQLEEEDPQLHVVWKEQLAEIHVQVMGEVQIEILTDMIKKRYDVDVVFSKGSIVYKETIARPVIGIGHFEPLRHYAEVQLLMEPGEPGSGLVFANKVSEDDLDKNWQRLILTHLEECEHPGVLTGSEITDMRITVIAGRAHIKHTEGGDFRQATYRAIRQGLRKARTVLLEPMYEFTLELPTNLLGRAMTDIQKMQGSFEPPQTLGELSVLKGKAPVLTMRGYQQEVVAYSGGKGRLSCVLKGYEPCHNEEEVVTRMAYDPEADLERPTGSVFCAHGAGFVVDWDQVDDYAHLEYAVDLKRVTQGSFGWKEESGQVMWARLEVEDLEDAEDERWLNQQRQTTRESRNSRSTSDYVTQEELDEIFLRTFGNNKREKNNPQKKWGRPQKPVLEAAPVYRPAVKVKKEEYLLVDGYNIIFAWEDLHELAERNIDSARDKLMDILCNYQGYKKNTLILVFDAYKVKGNPGHVVKYHNIYVVYTKEAETADQYIEKTVHEIGKKYDVTVATSDALEQMIIWGEGASRLSAAGLKEEVDKASAALAENIAGLAPKEKNRPFKGVTIRIEEEN